MAGNRDEAIVVYNGDGDDIHLNTHVFNFLHGGTKIKIFNIDYGVIYIWCGYGGVEMKFDGGKIGGGSDKVPVIIYLVSTNSESYLFWFSYLWGNCGYRTTIYCFL